MPRLGTAGLHAGFQGWQLGRSGTVQLHAGGGQLLGITLTMSHHRLCPSARQVALLQSFKIAELQACQYQLVAEGRAGCQALLARVHTAGRT